MAIYKLGRSTSSSAATSTTSMSTKEAKEDGVEVSETRPRPQPTDLEAVPEENESVDAVFGARKGEGALDYRKVGWLSTSVLLAKTQIGLGVLSIPSVFDTLGLATGIIALVVMAAWTTWSAFCIAWFKRAHPEVYSLADAVHLMGGPIFGIMFDAFYFIFMLFVAGLQFLTISTALNGISLHATCTAVFVAVAAIFCIPIAAIRRLSEIAWITWVGVFAIIIAVFTVTIAVPVGGKPALAPEGDYTINIVIWGTPSFASGMNAIASLVSAYAGVPAFMAIQSEMSNYRDFSKSLILCQSVVTVIYIVVGVVVYYYAGQYVASPALGTAGTLMKRISYGLALPGLLVGAILFVHLSAKFLFVRILKGSHHLAHGTRTHWAVWLSTTFGCGVVGYILASAIPVFGGLLGLIGACFGTAMSLHAESFMYLYDSRKQFKNPETRTLRLWIGWTINIVLIVVGSFILVGGTYGAAIAIRDAYRTSAGTPWSCADNSGSS
ncbi:hypothetical protein JCM11251_001105 [Rhodosporidiobolus azoricus]